MAKKVATKKKIAKAARGPKAKPVKAASKAMKAYRKRDDLNAPVAVVIDAMPPPQREMAWALDAVIRKAVGRRAVVSQVKWGNANYRVGEADLFAIAASKAYVSLYVGNGAKLQGSFATVFEGTGKLMRHVKCRTVDDAARKEVRDAVAAAIALADAETGTAWNKR